jgi:hypothetical protein
VARALERRRDRRTRAAGKPDIASLSYREAMNVAQEQSSCEYLSALLRAFGGNVSRAAERTGMEREPAPPAPSIRGPRRGVSE